MPPTEQFTENRTEQKSLLEIRCHWENIDAVNKNKLRGTRIEK